MDIHFMVFASPIFLILIVIECLLSLRNHTSLYQLKDTVNNFSTGILEEISALPIRGVIIASYYYLYEDYAFFHFNPKSVLTWVVLWIAVDFCYYWFHRASHRNNFFWIGHSVHHQSEHYNLSVALRQGYLQTLTSWVFYLPLALIGFPTWMFVTTITLNSIYQFWIHTQTIKKMGWLEHILNTPSHHRVHHGKNPQYIDKNYAGSLIIWDKWFGTFEPEIALVDYGVTEPLDSWNPFYANIKVITDLIYYGRGLKSKLNLVRAFFMPPEWIINQLKKEGTSIKKRQTRQNKSPSARAYLLINTGFCVFLYTYLSLTFNPNTLLSWLLGSLILLSLYSLGRLANANNTLWRLELIRTLLLIASLNALFNNLLMSISMGLVFILGNYWLLRQTRVVFNPDFVDSVNY